VSDEGVSEGTIDLGTQLIPYATITTASCCKAVGQSVELSDVIGINPAYKMWIRQSMLLNWRILYPHKFQIHAINNIAFNCDQIAYLIAKMGSGKSAILLAILLTVYWQPLAQGTPIQCTCTHDMQTQEAGCPLTTVCGGCIFLN
jgi:hypothetical protein